MRFPIADATGTVLALAALPGVMNTKQRKKLCVLSALTHLCCYKEKKKIKETKENKREKKNKGENKGSKDLGQVTEPL